MFFAELGSESLQELMVLVVNGRGTSKSKPQVPVLVGGAPLSSKGAEG